MLFGDDMNGDYAEGALELSAALQELNVTVYEGSNKSGEVLDSFTLDLVLAEEQASPLPDNVLASQYDQIVCHFDGNNNDPDDIAAIPIAALLADAAGIEEKTTFIYGNNLSQANAGGRLEALDTGGAFAESLGIDTYNYQDDIDGTTAYLAEMLNSGQSVLILEGGPLEATYRALEQTDPANLANVTLLSHSTWNQGRVVIDNPSDPDLTETRSWADIATDFPEVTLIEIADQNGGTHNFRGFYNQTWSWLDETENETYQEARSIMELAGEDAGKINDPSDAGMLFYALTGEDDGRPADVEEFLLDPAGYTLNDDDAPVIYPIEGTDQDDDMVGTDDPDFIYGGLGADVIGGWRGDDEIYGGGGRDKLSGHGGNDILYGGNEADTLMGGPGADQLYGGEGADTFVFYANGIVNLTDVGWDWSAVDVIQDFELGVDSIALFRNIGAEDRSDLSVWKKTIDDDVYFAVMVKDTKDALLVNVEDTTTWSEFMQSDPFEFF
ncbi:hypothetical protein E1297_12330 [Roseibium sp. RKSG952]|nr:hypothetical protein [Roseibium sp. RKSG952]